MTDVVGVPVYSYNFIYVCKPIVFLVTIFTDSFEDNFEYRKCTTFLCVLSLHGGVMIEYLILPINDNLLLTFQFLNA